MGFVDTFIEEHREAVMYLFFGGISFFLNIFLFIAIDQLFSIHELINNAICWIVCVLFQFLTNRVWVFDGRVETKVQLLKQGTSFLSGRIFTLILEEAIIFVFITCLGFNTTLIKLIAQVVVIVTNYILSKYVVFKK